MNWQLPANLFNIMIKMGGLLHLFYIAKEKYLTAYKTFAIIAYVKGETLAPIFEAGDGDDGAALVFIHVV